LAKRQQLKCWHEIGRDVILEGHDESVQGDIEPLNELTEGQIARVMALKEECERRWGIAIPLGSYFLRSLDRNGSGALAYIEEGRFIGFVFFYSFEKEEAEAFIFADPDADWKKVSVMLLEATKAECRRRGHSRLLLMNDRRYVEGYDLALAAGGKLSSSEHRMESRAAPAAPGQSIELRRVSNDDPELHAVELECHGMFYSKPDQARYLGIVDGEPVGKIDVYDDGTEVELTGFCVLPRFRGRGLGRAILKSTVRILRSQGKEGIILDVRTDNDVALSLYLRSGFEQRFTVDYYVISLEGMNTEEHGKH
jgi:ribosomal protein S18 acetylase RimI-like enzyme